MQQLKVVTTNRQKRSDLNSMFLKLCFSICFGFDVKILKLILLFVSIIRLHQMQSMTLSFVSLMWNFSVQKDLLD